MLVSLLLAVPISAAALPQAQDPAERFRTQYNEALELNDKKAIDGLLRKFKDQAIPEFVSKAETLAEGGGDRLGRWVDEFVESWQRVHHSSFARNYYRYLELMSPRTRKNRAEILKGRLPLLIQMHADALSKMSEDLWIPVREDAVGVVAAMRQAGDLYYLAALLYCQGNAYNSDLTDGSGADDQKALEIYEDYLQVRQQLGLTNDRDYAMVKTLVAEARAKLGIPDPSTGEVGERKVSRFEILPAEGADWIEIGLQFEAEKKPLAVQHPCDLADDHRLSWRRIDTGGVGTEHALEMLVPPVVVRRTAFGKFVLDGGAGPSEEFVLLTKPVVVSYQRKLADGRVVDHAMMLAGGVDTDIYQGTLLNLGVNDDSATVFYRSAATMTGDTPFGRITLYDHDGDGAYGYDKLGLAAAHGLPKETWHYRYDAVRLGKVKHSQPYSRYITDGKGDWFELFVEDYSDPKTIKLLPVAPRLGKVKVSMKGLKGLKLISLVLVSDTSQIRGTTVDLMMGKNGTLEVPIGHYKFQQGLVRGPKGAEAVILPGVGRAISLDVEEGTTRTIELGAPFSFKVDRRLDGNRLLIDGETLCVTGRSGERYVRLIGEPVFGVQVSLKGERAKGELRSSTTDEVLAHWRFIYLPQSLELELKHPVMPPMRLTLKKHPWFGKIDSGWMDDA